MSHFQYREAWRFNLDQEFALIRHILPRCRYATIDTEFPGTVYASSNHPHNLDSQRRYDFLKANIDDTKLIQLGLTLSDSVNEEGFTVTWEFNFRDFNPIKDLYASSSIELLRSRGIDFHKNLLCGIDSHYFAKLFRSSGLLFDNRINWITFHGSCDIGYLLKVLTGTKLPKSATEFRTLIMWYFGKNLFDIKYMVRFCNIYGGLERVGAALGVERKIGQCHQAGSDSLFTWEVFKNMRKRCFKNDDGFQHRGILFGIHDIDR